MKYENPCLQSIRPFQRTWAEIDLGQAEKNFLALKTSVDNAMKICCVIKANAYGHGALPMARLYESLGADYFAVATLEEAIELRKGKIGLPILILGYTPEEAVALLAEHQIAQCVYSYEYGTRLADAAKQAGVQLKIHIKLDTGMGRIGFLARKNGIDELDRVIEICQRDELIAEGIFTHFAVSDVEGEEGENYTREQLEQFEGAIKRLSAAGISFAIRHCANSAAALSLPSGICNMVRFGIVLYGVTSFAEQPKEIAPVMTLKTVVIHLKEIQAGESVGYGRNFIAKEPRKIATLPIGYADGYWRANRVTGGVMRIGEYYAPIVGNVCMDQTMIDVTEIPCQIGDEVIVFGKDEKCSAEALAKRNGTISYEVICALSRRVSRCFLKNE